MREGAMSKWMNGLAAGCLLLAMQTGATQAAEITVMGGMGVISGLRDLASGFASATGNKVNAVFDANPLAKVEAGAPIDIVALNPPVIDKLIASGKLVGPRVDFARAGIGVAVKAGAGKLDLSSVEAFKRAMRNAKSIGYSTAGSGLMVAKIMQDLGLTEELKARTKFLDGFPAAEAVARGEVEIALQQINVILPVAGAELGGVLPPELQQYNAFAAGVVATSKEKEVAAAMVKFMGAPENAALVRKSGMEPPAAR
jgi:molybdate transport system substrate-binding protein